MSTDAWFHEFEREETERLSRQDVAKEKIRRQNAAAGKRFADKDNKDDSNEA